MQLPLPPAHCLDHPLIFFIRKCSHDQVVEVDKVECAICIRPLLHGRQSNIRLRNDVLTVEDSEWLDIPGVPHMRSSEG